MSNCIITGCRLVIRDENKSVWGDLHQMDNIFMFNANVRNNNVAWEYIYPGFNSDERQAAIDYGCDYFEKRGIIVFGSYALELNEASGKYLADMTA